MAVQDNTEALSLPFFNAHECLDFKEFFNGPLQQNQLLQQRKQSQQKILNAQGFSSSFFPSTSPLMDVHVLVEKQRQEIDMLLRVQNEKFISVLQRLSSQHISSVLKKKDEEIAKANTKMIELQNHVWKLETENQLWQRTARDAEAAVVALKSAVERVRKESDDASSECCSSSNPRTPEKMVISCRTCESRDSCMLMLPCRHICSCKSCDWMNQLCPVCNSVKNGSIEVFFQ